VFTPSARRRRYTSVRRQLTAYALVALLVLPNVVFHAPAVHADTSTAISITALGSPLPTETFNSLVSTGTGTAAANTPAGWGFVELPGATGNSANTTYTAGTGSGNTGDTYSFGATGNSERAFGQLRSGAVTTVIGARYTNNSGGTITSLDISYTGEQWRIGNTAAARDDRMDFQYSLDATSLTTGTWNDVNALDFTNPVKTAASAGTLDGNLAANRASLSSSVTSLSIASGATFWIRWTDIDASGADDGLAIDDFNITPQGAAATPTPTPSPTPTPLPTLTINDVTQSEGNAGTTAFTFNVSLSSSAHSGVTFDICTADGTAQDDNPATEDNDYQANCLTGQTIAGGSAGPYQFTVQVNGDAVSEPNETFFVNVTNVTGATVTDGQGLGTITNDDISLLLISQVQGSTPSGNAPSPYAGQTVSVRGIVTLLKSNGFFLQEEVSDNDSDPNTSEGIFVFTSAAPTTAVGNQVTVTGSVVEFNGLTEISATNPNVSTNNTGNSPPTAVTITPADLPANAHYTQPQLEKYEGMRLFAASLTTVAPNDNFFDVYTVITGQPRPLREPGIEANKNVPPDPTSGTPDPNIPRFDLNPERIVVDTNGRAGSTGETMTSNVVITNLAGPLDYAFGAYRIINEANLTRSANMSAVPLPAPSPSEFTVAGYNIENFNNNATQRVKAAMTICDVIRTPDIIGVVEIFDLEDLQALAVEVQTRCGVAYSSHLIEADGSASGDNDQDVGYLVKTSRVAVDSVTQEREEETFVPPGSSTPAILHDRPPLVLRGRVDPSGVNLPVITVVNHTRSFICIDADADPAVAAGCDNGAADGPRVREKRKKQAESLAGLFQELQTNNPGTSVIAVGDYNAFQFNNGYDDPISVMKGNPTPDDQIVVDQSPDLVNPNFVNLIDKLPVSEQYTFNFENTLQALDHHLVNTVADARNTRIAIGRVNSDYPDTPASAFASNNTRPERNSDHDPVVSYYTLAAPATAGQLIISEFRLDGPGGDLDEFIEVYNNQDVAHKVITADGSAGYAVVAGSDGQVRCTIPVNTTIPARGHFLCVNTGGYSLASYPAGDGTTATGDAIYSVDIPDNSGLALFNTANPANFNGTNRLDAVGFTSEPNTLYREGAGLQPLVSPTPVTDYSLVRKLPGGCHGFAGNVNDDCNTLADVQNRPGPISPYPVDNNDNATDFLLVDVQATPNGGQQRLGAPGPENLSSPVANVARQLVVQNMDPYSPSTGAPNRVRNTGATGTNATYGTLEIRKAFFNSTGAPITRLRFRIMDFTTRPAPGSVPTASCSGSTCVADMRALTSGPLVGVASSQGPKDVQGTTLEEPPVQSLGGGWNSSLSVGTITLAQPLAPGQGINVRFLLGVEQNGKFRFFFTVEALP
jgi:predicted extracellular nuclease